ncbi:hypothetical protein K2Q02_02850 [Patescibacteria group bacterium]|nr:hypothetical protein [Patescibacteria group bacterium]
MEYIVEYLPDPNHLRLRLMCLLDAKRRVMRSKEDVVNCVPYAHVFMEWFDCGISEIELFQYPGFLVVNLKKDTEKDLDTLLAEIMTKSYKWEELTPRITDPLAVWPFHYL